MYYLPLVKHPSAYCLVVSVWLSLAYAPATHADLTSDAKYLDPGVVARCRRALQVAPREQDLPDASERARLTECDSTALYYGIGQTKNVHDARLCAHIEIEEQRAGTLGGEHVLIGVYANGEGVARNPELARRYACETYMAPAELQNLLTKIAALETHAGTTTPLVYCDEMTSGYMTGACADLADRNAALQRSARASAALGPSNPAQRKAWRALRKALQQFAEEHADNEIDLSGTQRGALMVQAEAETDEEFTRLLVALSANKKPEAFGLQPLAASERALSAAYRAATQVEVNAMTVTAEGVRSTQRAWIGYRAAWLEFARVRFPDLKTDMLSAWLADRRTLQLKELDGTTRGEASQP